MVITINAEKYLIQLKLPVLKKTVNNRSIPQCNIGLIHPTHSPQDAT